MSGVAKSGLTRRSALKAAALGMLGAPAILRSARADGLEKIKFTLSWLPEGFYAYAFVAKAKGYWSARGLDVDIARGYGSLPAAQAIAQGQFDFGVSNASAVVQLATKGVDLRGLAVMDYEPSMGVAVLEESPIRAPKDLEGKQVAQTLSSSDAAFFQPFCNMNGVDFSKVKLLNMDARVRNQALAEGRVDAITGFASSMLAAIGSTGKGVRFMLYSDYGLFLYGDIALLVPPKTLDARPELCQAVADGLLEGLKFTLTHPDEAQALFLDAVPELKLTATGPEFARLGIGVQRFNVLAVPDAKLHGLGWSDPAKLDQMADFVMKYQADLGSQKPDMAARFPDRFAGRIKLSDDEWKQAEVDTRWVAKQLRKEA